MTDHIKEIADDDWLRVHVADKLGISLLAAQESLSGEKVSTCERLVKEVINEESRLRADKGWPYTVRNFNAGRSLKRMARAEALGLWTTVVPTQGEKPSPGEPRRRPEERPNTEERKKRQKGRIK